ncbi:uncharacterized protein N7459_009595 [Penicillium hispanicum]|uniref:uncharacterized protein n=1 Tax=Penicillium hispanicum TaxID=1080232 RepID=UPI002540B6DC|nr:uncharacterized protein N7459_009595 [Penicillium hispanicum]KAJ5570165.1 hypothetical protein N7459_009595 [Penicillium hispanicum]
MLDFIDDASRREKCFTTITELSNFVDPKQIPSKKTPFSAIINHPFVHTVEAILPEDVYTSFQAALEAKLEKPQCVRVFMSPSDLLEHDFFNTYIKAGNVIMVSEGSSGSDIVYTLHDGILKIEMGKEVFERTGLSGKPIRSGGRKHGKERFLVELNLRLPSMLHGKKGFERIVWAFKNVLEHSLAWLFCDLGSTSSQSDGTKPIQKLHPQVVECAPLRNSFGPVVVPPLVGLGSNETPETELQENCGTLAEWISMVQLRSPRVFVGDDVDPYLSRYSVPGDETSSSALISLKWHGLVPPEWTMQLFLNLLSETAKSKSPAAWFILSASAMNKQAVDGRDGFTIVTAPQVWSSTSSGAKDREPAESQKRHTICWELVGATTTEV